MEVRIVGKEYLLMNNYDKITIENCTERRNYVIRDNFGAFIGGGFETLPTTENVDIIIEKSNQKIKDSFITDTESEILDENILNKLCGLNLVEEIISDFLTNNIIAYIDYNSSKKNTDFNHSSISTYSGKILNFKLVDSDYFNLIMKKFEQKYMEDCIQFLKDNKDKKICNLKINTYSMFSFYIEPAKLSGKFMSCFEDISKQQEIIRINIEEFCVFSLFEKMLNIENDKVFFEVMDEKNKIFKVICNDYIVIIDGTRLNFFQNVREIMENIIERHNQSIEKGKKLLMELEKGEKELW